MASLPVFQTGVERQPDVPVDKVARDVFGGRDLSIETRGSTTTVRSADIVIDHDQGRGGLWAGDIGRRWRPEAVDVAVRSVGRIARNAFKELNVLPTLNGPFQFAKPTITRASTVTEQDGQRSTALGDATFSQEILVDVSGRRGIEGNTLPFFGGGARFAATVGTGGQVVGVRGVWRDAVEADVRPVRPVEEAVEAAGLKLGDGVRMTGSTLGYYSAPAFASQELVFPVYAVTAEVRNGDAWIPSRIMLVPATDVGELGTRETQVEPRVDPLPAVKSRFKIRPGSALPAGLTVSSAVLRKRGLSPEKFLTRDASGKIFVKPGLTGIDISALLEAIRPRSFGTSWIGSLGGLGGSQANAQGFVDEMSAEGWQRRFNWGNAAAFKSDWTTNDDTWVDDVDFVFYTGHAGPDGWMLATNGAGDWIDFSEVGATPNVPSDLWGQNNLEWAVIAACGPLEDDIINGGGNVFDRWRGAFDGLHMLLGYAAVTYDNTEEGRRIASYARQGMTMRQAWFRTAEEIQPATNGYGDPYGPSVQAGAMYIGGPGGDTGNDHLWGHGSVGPDVRNSTWRAVQYSPC